MRVPNNRRLGLLGSFCQTQFSSPALGFVLPNSICQTQFGPPLLGFVLPNSVRPSSVWLRSAKSIRRSSTWLRSAKLGSALPHLASFCQTQFSAHLGLGFVLPNSVQRSLWVRSAKLQLIIDYFTGFINLHLPPEIIANGLRSLAGLVVIPSRSKSKIGEIPALKRNPTVCDAASASTSCVKRQDDSKTNQGVDRLFCRNWVEIELPIPF